MSKVIMNSSRHGRIKINTPPGSSVKSNADEITMVDVEQHSSGGVISHKAKGTLNQVGNKMSAEDGGEIVNQSDGNLNQIDNDMSAKKDGRISNVVKKTALGGLLLGILSVIADALGIISFFGKN